MLAEKPYHFLLKLSNCPDFSTFASSASNNETDFGMQGR